MTQSSGNGFFFPWAALIWLAVSAIVFVLGQQVVSLQDVERFPNDVELVVADEPAENTVVLGVISGTFEYNVRSEEPAVVTTGEFSSADESPLARVIFTALESVPVASVDTVTVDEQSVTVTYTGEAEGDVILRRLRNPVVSFLLNEQSTIEAVVSEEEANTIVFSTTDERLRYARFVPTLVPAETEEVYDSREAGLNGSPLAQALFAGSERIDALTIRPGELVVTYNRGNANQMLRQAQDALNEFFPRASLRPDLWVFTLGYSSSVIVNITPLDTLIPLLWFTLGFALLELVLGFYYRSREEKLVRPLIRATGVFLLFWSLFGHEPVWDFILSIIFPDSRQLVHPNATVIDFAAQHLELVLVSSLITVPGGLIIGIMVTRQGFRELLPLVNNLVNSGQTIPTIAIVAVMAPLIGFGFWPAIIALVAYGLLPVVRNTIAGLEGVDRFIIDSARGMGMTPSQILFQIELPIASRVIMAGVRTSMVVNVGTATLGAFVGSGGLGTPIASGLAMSIDAFILLGALPAAVLAILIDYILDRVEFVLTPRGLQIA